jgi:hypothetical protein
MGNKRRKKAINQIKRKERIAGNIIVWLGI